MNLKEKSNYKTMALIPYEPFNEIDDFFGDDDWFFPVRSKRIMSAPEMDVYETEDSVVVEISAPGMDPKDLTVTIDNDLLKIKGEKEEDKEEKDKERGYYSREIRRGSFERAVRLPSNIDEEKIKARHEKGILKIKIPKIERDEKEGKEIEIEIK
jgi:HSP20 family protein